MPQSIPAFDQYQAPLVPLRGLWNVAPQEGDRYIQAEINWLVTTKQSAVQFQLAGNSPVALSQVVALYVDNSRSGADCKFVFPDSGFSLTVPAHNQGLFPVLTNAVMFYASAPNAIAGDTTIFQALNSMPPLIPIAPSREQNTAAAIGLPLSNGSTQLIPAGINGTLNSASMTIVPTGGASLGVVTLTLQDGAGRNLWTGTFEVPAGVTQSFPVNLSGLFLRFQNGLKVIVSGATSVSGWATINVFYSVP
jgi:hypothetical protein